MNPIKENDFFILVNGKVGKVLSVESEYIRSSSLGRINKASILKYSEDLKSLVSSGDYVNGIEAKPYGDDFLIGHQPLQDVSIEHFMTKTEFQSHGFYLKDSFSLEQWKPIKDYPDYEISSLGRVRRVKDWGILAYCSDREQYSVRMTNKDGLRRRKSVPALVLEAFVEESKGRIPKYKDGDPQNCSLSNLEWETHSEQAKRVLPKIRVNSAKYKYLYIVGYFKGNPIIHAKNTRELVSFLKTHCPDMEHALLNHISNNIRKGIPYKGILFKCVPREVYSQISVQFPNRYFEDIYKENLLEKNMHRISRNAKNQKVPKIKTTKKAKIMAKDIPHKDKLKELDNISNEEIFESIKREDFKRNLLKALGR